jgi:hypothetical protein
MYCARYHVAQENVERSKRNRTWTVFHMPCAERSERGRTEEKRSTRQGLRVLKIEIANAAYDTEGVASGARCELATKSCSHSAFSRFGRLTGTSCLRVSKIAVFSRPTVLPQ